MVKFEFTINIGNMGLNNRQLKKEVRSRALNLMNLALLNAHFVGNVFCNSTFDMAIEIGEHSAEV